MYNVIGVVTSGAGSETPGRPLVGPPQFWVDRLSAYVKELGFDGLIFWPAQQPKDQAELFASEVLPALRAQFPLAHSVSSTVMEEDRHASTPEDR